MSENPLKCTTQDEKNLIFISIFFTLCFDPQKNNESKVVKILEGLYFRLLQL
jgi:hypothetical protein